MGNSSSSGSSSAVVVGTAADRQETAKRIAWAMPSWCIDNYRVTSATVDAASASWRYAMSGQSPPFLAAKAKENLLTPLVFFYNQFYSFLFELLPDTKVLFTKGMKGQGRMLANVIKYIITNLNGADERVLHHSLEHLARVHNLKGITPDMYSVMGMVLVHTVRICTGNEFWTASHKDAWVQIYSKMMSVIIPVVISGAMPTGGESTTMAPIEQIEFYKRGNLNAEADPDRTSANTASASSGSMHVRGGSRTASAPLKPPLKMACPVSGTVADDIELSHTMKMHLAENAAAHLQMLEAEATAAAASGVGGGADAARKYHVLTRVLDLAQRVEAQLAEIGAAHSSSPVSAAPTSMRATNKGAGVNHVVASTSPTSKSTSLGIGVGSHHSRTRSSMRPGSADINSGSSVPPMLLTAQELQRLRSAPMPVPSPTAGRTPAHGSTPSTTPRRASLLKVHPHRRGDGIGTPSQGSPSMSGARSGETPEALELELAVLKLFVAAGAVMALPSESTAAAPHIQPLSPISASAPSTPASVSIPVSTSAPVVLSPPLSSPRARLRLHVSTEARAALSPEMRDLLHHLATSPAGNSHSHIATPTATPTASPLTGFGQSPTSDRKDIPVGTPSPTMTYVPEMPTHAKADGDTRHVQKVQQQRREYLSYTTCT